MQLLLLFFRNKHFCVVSLAVQKGTKNYLQNSKLLYQNQNAFFILELKKLYYPKLPRIFLVVVVLTDSLQGMGTADSRATRLFKYNAPPSQRLGVAPPEYGFKVKTVEQTS